MFVQKVRKVVAGHGLKSRQGNPEFCRGAEGQGEGIRDSVFLTSVHGWCLGRRRLGL